MDHLSKLSCKKRFGEVREGSRTKLSGARSRTKERSCKVLHGCEKIVITLKCVTR